MGTPLLIDNYVSRPDAEIAAQRIIAATPDVTFAAARALDLLEVRTPLLTASLWLRGLPAKVLRRPEPPPPEQLTLEGELGLPGWMLLDEEHGREVGAHAEAQNAAPTKSRKPASTT